MAENKVPPPPSALPDLQSLGLGTGKSNPFAPRASSASPSALLSGLPPPPAALPGLGSTTKPSPNASPLPPPPVSILAQPPSTVEEPLAMPKQPSPSPAAGKPLPPMQPPIKNVTPPPPAALSPVAPQNPGPPPNIAVRETSPPSAQPVSPVPPPRVPEATAEAPKAQPVKSDTAQPTEGSGEGMFDWLTKQMHENTFLSKVAEKAKVGMETVLTTLDPGMKDFMGDGSGLVELHVATEDPMVSSAVRQGFERVFNSAVVRGVPVPQDDSSRLSLSLEAADRVCAEKVKRLAASRLASPASPFIVLQPYIMQIGQGHFYAIRLMLRWRGVDFYTFSQPVELSPELVAHLEKSPKQPDGGLGQSLEQMHGNENFLPFHPSELLILPAALIARKLSAKIAEEAQKQEAASNPAEKA
ncbi:unnamed protein product, partial [Mesorhabditis spiculigera]